MTYSLIDPALYTPCTLFRMNDPELPATKTVSVYSRHLSTCPHKDEPYYRGKGCDCPRWIYVNDGSERRRFSAKTRNWARAESIAQEERSKLDPVKRKLVEIEEEDRRAKAARQAARIEIDVALNRWLDSEKDITSGTREAYRGTTRRISRWAKRKKLTYLDEITADMLDEWRGQWSKASANREDRIGPSTQSSFLVRMKAFFKWAVSIKLIRESPAAYLKKIRPQYAPPTPLTQSQFEQLLDAIDPYTQSRTDEVREFANEFRALFLLQRATGLRLVDCLTLPRKALNGNRMITKTQKTGAKVDRRLPAPVVEAFSRLSSKRERFRPDYFLWGSYITDLKSLSSRWGKIIAPMNKLLNFVDENGQPFNFHTHVLRDTFAVDRFVDDFTIEEVSRLLTHESIKTTEQHYIKWVKRREEQLQEKLERSLERMGMPI